MGDTKVIAKASDWRELRVIGVIIHDRPGPVLMHIKDSCCPATRPMGRAYDPRYEQRKIDYS